MIKIAHEAPNEIFNLVQRSTNYDYCLAHLFHENKVYKQNFLDAKKIGRDIMLDTSVFELGSSFDSKLYKEIIDELEPDYFILPDVLENEEHTVMESLNFLSEYKNLIGKKVGVLQGRNISELLTCYRLLSQKCNIIAISFDYSCYLDLVEKSDSLNIYTRYMSGRIKFLKELFGSFEYRTNPKPIHLLGCYLPQEFTYYHNYPQIISIDTSNPIVHGLKHISYYNYGLLTKESTKLYTLIDSQVNNTQLDYIRSNIKQFRFFVNGY